MNSIPDREKRRQSLQCRLYGLPRAYPRMQGEGMLERTMTVGIFTSDNAIPGAVHISNGVIEILSVTLQIIFINLILQKVSSSTE